MDETTIHLISDKEHKWKNVLKGGEILHVLTIFSFIVCTTTVSLIRKNSRL